MMYKEIDTQILKIILETALQDGEAEATSATVPCQIWGWNRKGPLRRSCATTSNAVQWILCRRIGNVVLSHVMMNSNRIVGINKTS